jgi:hypothetical protein
VYFCIFAYSSRTDIPVYFCIFAYSSRTDIPVRTKLGMLVLWDQHFFRNIKTSTKLSSVWFPVRAVPVARKLSTIEERRPNQNYLFRIGDSGKSSHNTEKLSLVRVPVIIFLWLGYEAWWKTGAKAKFRYLFRLRDYRSKTITTKMCPGFKCQWRWFVQVGNDPSYGSIHTDTAHQLHGKDTEILSLVYAIRSIYNNKRDKVNLWQADVDIARSFYIF